MANLRAATETQDCTSSVGIAHTRWATHGPPDDKNAHPHFSADKTVAVVHNGIIENYRELQTMLERVHGYKFASQTDTELLAHLAHFVRPHAAPAPCLPSCRGLMLCVLQTRQQDPSLSLTDVVKLTLRQVQGAFGVCFLFADAPNIVIGGRKGSPLLLGIGKAETAEDGSAGVVKECFFASDASAVIEYTNKVPFLLLYPSLSPLFCVCKGAPVSSGRVHRRRRRVHADQEPERGSVVRD